MGDALFAAAGGSGPVKEHELSNVARVPGGKTGASSKVLAPGELEVVSGRGKVDKPGQLTGKELYKQSWGLVAGEGAGAWFKANQTEMVAGFTTALTVVPTALAFAFLGSMTAQEGLMGTWIIMLVLAVAGGCPGMIYCNAGAVAVVLVDLQTKNGSEFVFWAFMLSGVITSLLSLVGVAKLLRLLPASVMVGFVNGLAIVIFLAQLKSFQVASDDDGPGGGHRRLGGGFVGDEQRRLNSFAVFEGNPEWVSGGELGFMLLNVFITMAAMFAAPMFSWTKKVPGALAGVVTAMVVEWLVVRTICGGETTTVGDVAKVEAVIPVPVWLSSDYSMPPLNGETLGTVLPTAITITAVGLVESLMTVRYVSGRTKVAADPNVEALMLGIGNIFAGAFGGQGGCSEVGLTLINLNSGGANRVSALTAGLLTLVIMYAAYPVINAVPVAGLAGIMFVVCTHCFDFGSLKTISSSLLPKWVREKYALGISHKINRIDAVVIVAVTVITPFYDLAIAVGVGCIIAMCGFTWETADRLTVEVVFNPDKEAPKVYIVTGQIYYASVDNFKACFDVEGDPSVVEVQLQTADVCDYSALQALNGLGDEYRAAGKTLQLRRMRPKTVKVLHKAVSLLSAFDSAERGSLAGSLKLGRADSTATDAADVDLDVEVVGGANKMDIESYH